MGTRRNIVVGPAVADWVASVNKQSGPYPGGQGIGIECDGRLLGGLAFCNYRGVSIEVHCASDKSRNWVTRKWLHDIFDYAFRQLGVKKIFGIISAGNAEIVKFADDIGFKVETPIKDVFPNCDALVIYMTPTMCRWIDYKRYPQTQQQPKADIVDQEVDISAGPHIRFTSDSVFVNKNYSAATGLNLDHYWLGQEQLQRNSK